MSELNWADWSFYLIMGAVILILLFQKAKDRTIRMWLRILGWFLAILWLAVFAIDFCFR